MKSIKKKYTTPAVLLCLLLTSINCYALDEPKHSEIANPTAIVLVVIALVLLLAIAMLSFVLVGSADLYLQKLKDRSRSNENAFKVTIIAALCSAGFGVSAQESAGVQSGVHQVSTSIAGLATSSFYLLISVVALELLILLAMLYFIKALMIKEKTATKIVRLKISRLSLHLLWQKINSFKPRNEEQDIMLDHNYDGIKELDNRLPRWWLWGFYLTVVFAFIYLYRFHVAHTAPLSIDEFEIAMSNANREREEYLKKAASNVDENSVTMLTAAVEVEEGKKIFQSTCSACHGLEGQGGVGPNLTDNYWLHKGSINDVFRTIKYGYPEKGMKSWKDDFSPTQIAKIASYVKTLTGTNPVNPKEPQGELYKDIETPVKDSVNFRAKKNSGLSEGITRK